ncbi:MAG: phytoene/squalene synthase family protein [Deltaproteobacteria bacterium]|nr:phytoene/squalene synthase family protein [Deltaproteobacteria bacterium]
MSPATPAAVVAASHDSLQKHARTFSWAAALLGRRLRDDVAVAYAFCRYLDDLADESPDPHLAEQALNRVRADLLRGESAEPLVGAMLELVRQRQLDVGALLALVDGVQSDLGSVQLRSAADFDRYCYQVAGAVGVLMCGLLGVRDPRALPYAVDLGLAMQRTNICRDVTEDAARGRTYLPVSQLREENLTPTALLGAQAAPPGAVVVVARVLADADGLYASARHGYRFLPLRARLAVAVAGRLYQMIGEQLRRQGGDPWRGRAAVAGWRKLLGAAGAVATAIVAPLWRRDHDPRLHAHLQGLPGVDPGSAATPDRADLPPVGARTALR